MLRGKELAGKNWKTLLALRYATVMSLAVTSLLSCFQIFLQPMMFLFIFRPKCCQFKLSMEFARGAC